MSSQVHGKSAAHGAAHRGAKPVHHAGEHPLPGEEALEDFHRKYPRAVPGSGVGVGPIQSTTEATAHVRDHQHSREHQTARQVRLREKRAHLRELQEWEYKTLTTPPRRANTAAVGLYTFSLTFILLGLHYTGHFALDTVLPSMTICFGGGLQLIAGVLSWIQGSTFAYVSFVLHGAFFLSLTCLWMLPNASFKSTSPVQASSEYFTGIFYAVWTIINFFLLCCTPAMNLLLMFKFLTTTLSLLCLAVGMMKGNETVVHAGGYLGIITGATALYMFIAMLLNEVWDIDFFPMGQTTTLLDRVSGKAKSHAGQSEEESLRVDSCKSDSV